MVESLSLSLSLSLSVFLLLLWILYCNTAVTSCVCSYSDALHSRSPVIFPKSEFVHYHFTNIFSCPCWLLLLLLLLLLLSLSLSLSLSLISRTNLHQPSRIQITKKIYFELYHFNISCICNPTRDKKELLKKSKHKILWTQNTHGIIFSIF